MTWIKNTDTVNHTYGGQLINSGEYYEIQYFELSSWANNSLLLTDIGSGKATVAKDNSGNNDLTDVNDGISYLKQLPESPLDTENAPLIRSKMAPQGWSYQLRGFEFETSVSGSIFNEDCSGVDLGDVGIKFYDSDDVEITDPGSVSGCIKTTVDFEPTYDYEIIGGKAFIETKPLNNVRLWVVAVPDIPSPKTFVNATNFKKVENVIIDGRTSKRLNYNAVYHLNKVSFIIKHNVGERHCISILFEHYFNQ